MENRERLWLMWIQNRHLFPLCLNSRRSLPLREGTPPSVTGVGVCVSPSRRSVPAMPPVAGVAGGFPSAAVSADAHIHAHEVQEPRNLSPGAGVGSRPEGPVLSGLEAGTPPVQRTAVCFGCRQNPFCGENEGPGSPCWGAAPCKSHLPMGRRGSRAGQVLTLMGLGLGWGGGRRWDPGDGQLSLRHREAPAPSRTSRPASTL